MLTIGDVDSRDLRCTDTGICFLAKVEMAGADSNRDIESERNREGARGG